MKYEFFTENVFVEYIEQDLRTTSLDESAYMTAMSESGWELVKIGDRVSKGFGATKREFVWKRPFTGEKWSSIAEKYRRQTSPGLGYNVIP